MGNHLISSNQTNLLSVLDCLRLTAAAYLANHEDPQRVQSLMDGTRTLAMPFQQELLPGFILWDTVDDHEDRMGFVYLLILSCSVGAELHASGITEDGDLHEESVPLEPGLFISFDDYTTHGTGGMAVALYIACKSEDPDGALDTLTKFVEASRGMSPQEIVEYVKTRSFC